MNQIRTRLFQSDMNCNTRWKCWVIHVSGAQRRCLLCFTVLDCIPGYKAGHAFSSKPWRRSRLAMQSAMNSRKNARRGAHAGNSARQCSVAFTTGAFTTVKSCRASEDRKDISAPDSEAHVPEHARSAAITHVLQLNDQAVGIGEVQFRRAFLCPTAIFLPHADVVDERTGRPLTVAAWFDPVCLQRLDHRVRVEILERHAQVVDGGAGRSARSAAA